MLTVVRQRAKATLAALARWGVPTVRARLLETLPHEGRGFTQGLAFHDGRLYESTGGETNSSLRLLDADDGRLLRSTPIEGDFAEGIAVVGGRLFQLSWKSGVAREFTLPDLQPAGAHRYPGEGWGLAAVGDRLVSSDGSSRLRFWSKRFEPLGTLRVTSNGVPLRWLNDLECVGDRLYLNVVALSHLVEFSISKGSVTRLIDCGELVERESPTEPYQVFNGVAYHPGRDALFVTGKQWKSLFVIGVPA